jgi:hypothetical protein
MKSVIIVSLLVIGISMVNGKLGKPFNCDSNKVILQPFATKGPLAVIHADHELYSGGVVAFVAPKLPWAFSQYFDKVTEAKYTLTKDSPEIIWQVYERGDNEFAFKNEKLKRYLKARDWWGGWKVLANGKNLGSWETFKTGCMGCPEAKYKGTFALGTAHGYFIKIKHDGADGNKLKVEQSKYCCTDTTRFSFKCKD